MFIGSCTSDTLTQRLHKYATKKCKKKKQARKGALSLLQDNKILLPNLCIQPWCCCVLEESNRRILNTV